MFRVSKVVIMSFLIANVELHFAVGWSCTRTNIKQSTRSTFTCIKILPRTGVYLTDQCFWTSSGRFFCSVTTLHIFVLIQLGVFVDVSTNYLKMSLDILM